MNIYNVRIWDSHESWESPFSIGLFSNIDVAHEAGIHASERRNRELDYPDRYHHDVFVVLVDEYVIKNLSPLAKALQEEV